MDRLCIDLIGPINPPYGEFYYVFVIIDSFSRFLQLYGRKHDFGNFEYPDYSIYNKKIGILTCKLFFYM
jgi:hypothetical protein